MTILAEGMNAVQVAETLFISPETTENHRSSNIMRKLGLHSTIELVRYAAEIGLIDIDLWKDTGHYFLRSALSITDDADCPLVKKMKATLDSAHP